jgi:hypothetical protein
MISSSGSINKTFVLRQAIIVPKTTRWWASYDWNTKLIADYAQAEQIEIGIARATPYGISKG